MILRRWSESERRHMPYVVPDDWHVSTYEADMSTLVNCCQCGRKLPFGETYTSMQVQTSVGFGYAVCRDCYFGLEIPECEKARRTHDVD